MADRDFGIDDPLTRIDPDCERLFAQDPRALFERRHRQLLVAVLRRSDDETIEVWHRGNTQRVGRWLSADRVARARAVASRTSATATISTSGKVANDRA